MDYKCLVLLLCFSGAAAQSISIFPGSPVGVTVGEPVVIECGITGLSSDKVVLWTRVDLGGSGSEQVYYHNGGSGEAAPGFTVEPYAEGSIEYFNLRIDSPTRSLAGFYTCSCLNEYPEVAVLVFEPPVFKDDDTLVEEVDTTFRCEVTYASPVADQELFSFHIEDETGSVLDQSNDTVVDSTVGGLEYTRIEYSQPVQLDWADDGQEYACVISMPGGYEENTTLPLSVFHKANNESLDPYDPEMIYYRSEEVTVLYSSNPPAKQFMWYREESPENWVLVDGEEDAEATITINSGWPDQTKLKVEIINEFDHNGDGTVTDQMANYTFHMTLRDCCRTSDAGQLPYSVLVTTLLALLATFFLER